MVHESKPNGLISNCDVPCIAPISLNESINNMKICEGEIKRNYGRGRGTTEWSLRIMCPYYLNEPQSSIKEEKFMLCDVKYIQNVNK